MAKKKKKVTKKAPARKKIPARPKRSPVVAPDEVSQEAAAPTTGARKKKPKSRAVTAEDVAGKEKAPEEPPPEPEPEFEEEVITAVEVELRETVYDLLARESQRRKMQPGECAAMLVELSLSLTSIALPAPIRVAGNLVDDDKPDDDNDAVLEDPEFQDSFEQLVQGGA